MSEASKATYAELPKDEHGTPKKGMNVDQFVAWIKEFGPITIHDLADKLDSLGITWPGRSTKKTGQVWSELMSRAARAAQLGLVDDDEMVQHVAPGNTRSQRTLYKYLPIPRAPRMSVRERLEAEILKLKNELASMRYKYEDACADIDRLTTPA